MPVLTSQDFNSRLEKDAKESLDVVRRTFFKAAMNSLSIREPVQTQQEGPPAVEKVSFGAYLRTVWAVLWTAILHPFTTTVIDARTGKVLRP